MLNNLAPPGPEAEAVIRAALPLVAEHGWTEATLRAAMAAVGQDPGLLRNLFPRGASDAIAAWAALADRDMAAVAERDDLLAQRIPARIRRLVQIRLELAEPHREALRRALAHLATCAPGTAACITARTADAIWDAAGDTSSDLSRYTRRATLAGIYTATLAYWLRDGDTDAAMRFLDRRLAGLARFQKFQRRFRRAA